MRVLIAFDKFKDALSAAEACAVATTTLRAQHPDWQLDPCPLTDGGEGFGETLTTAAHGEIRTPSVAGPRGQPVKAQLGLITAQNIPANATRHLALGNNPSAINAPLAIVDLSSASGLALLAPSERDPWQTSTYGTGELVRLAAEAGAGTILIGVGGSATNDLGLGALAALGFKFYDGAGADLGVPTPARWSQIQRIDRSGAKKISAIFIACDVTNPLLGPRGATTIFGPQKGLRATDIARLEAQAARLAALLCATCGQSFTLAHTPGAGAAGGISFGLMVAYGAKLVPGYDLVSDWLNLPSRIHAADLILTGEGRFDLTSLEGKGPGSLVNAARRLGKPVHVFAGSLGLPADRELHAITPTDLPLALALPRTAELLASAIARVRLEQLPPR